MKPGIGVVIGRFQAHKLTDGHVCILKEASRHEKMLVLIGSHGGQPTQRNPLPFHIRRNMVLEAFPHAAIDEIIDMPDDSEWSRQVDGLIGEGPAVLYAGRDSFSDFYSGRFRIEHIPEYRNVSATKLRDSLREKGGESFRAGIIYATKLRFPTVYPTVDIALRRTINGESHILLGRKQNELSWRFPGGFVDPKDESMLATAMRELKEEAGAFDTHEWEYVTSVLVEDRRYTDCPDCIMTSLFTTSYAWGAEPHAGDDLVEVRWFRLSDMRAVITEQHLPLVGAMEAWFNEKQHHQKD